MIIPAIDLFRLKCCPLNKTVMFVRNWFFVTERSLFVWNFLWIWLRDGKPTIKISWKHSIVAFRVLDSTGSLCTATHVSRPSHQCLWVHFSETHGMLIGSEPTMPLFFEEKPTRETNKCKQSNQRLSRKKKQNKKKPCYAITLERNLFWQQHVHCIQHYNQLAVLSRKRINNQLWILHYFNGHIILLCNSTRCNATNYF